MVFSRIWPVVLLIAIPAIIILYILKPKGKEKVIPSSLLWKRTLRNVVSRSRLEKFRSDILFFLEIFAALFLVLGLMEPLFQRIGTGGKSTVLVIDTSAGMEFMDGGRTRLEEAIEEAIGIVRSSSGEFSIVAVDEEAELILGASSDKYQIMESLKKITVRDRKGNMASAVSLLSSIKADRVLVFTDGQGAGGANAFSEAGLKPSVYCFGEERANVGISSFVAKNREAVVMCSNYGDEIGFDLTLRDASGNLLALRSVTMAKNEVRSFVFQELEIPENCEYLSCDMSGFSGEDGLERDNTAYCILKKKNDMEAALIGKGNIYVERAFYAVTGDTLAKQETVSGGETLAIFDAGTITNAELFDDQREEDYIAFTKPEGETVLEHALISFPESELTNGMSFTIGVVKTAYFTVPDWAEGFAYSNGQCVAYYGNHLGKKRIVFGFDLRDTDFALTPEFPILMSGMLDYIREDGILTQNSVQAGELLSLSGMIDPSLCSVRSAATEAGIYEVEGTTYTGEQKKEKYVVVFPAGESDGSLTAENSLFSGEIEASKFRSSMKVPVLILLSILLIIHLFVYVRSMGWRKYLAVGLMGATIVCTILAMFPIRISGIRSKPVTVFVVDVSDSNASAKEAMEDYLSKKLREKPKENEYGIVVFGRNAAIEQFVTEENHFTGLMATVDSSGTNFTEALLLAESLIPEQGGGRIVILSDNIETTGNVQKLNLSSSVEICNIKFENARPADVNVSSVDLPETVHPGDLYRMKVTIYSSLETEAELVIRTGSEESERKNVHLNRGENTFSFEETAGENGLDSYQIEILAAGDEVAENNVYRAETRVITAPRTLVISGLKEDSSGLLSILKAGNSDCYMVSAINAPDTMEKMLEYKSIVLDNVAEYDLPEGFMKNVESYVKDFGGGLVAVGGENAFMLGGYRDTALETVLPIDMKLSGMNYIPPSAIIMIIDRSGSMLGEGDEDKLHTAIDSVILAIDTMQPEDICGVIAFDSVAEWIVTPTQVTDRESLKNKVRAISVGGGTTITPALELGLKGLQNIDEGVKHMILLTDGEGETDNYADIEKRINANGITLSTIAVGRDSDQRLLMQMANACNGRFYYSEDAKSLTQIFAKEVMIMGDAYIQKGDFSVLRVGSNEILDGIYTEGFPNISGYIASSPKNASTVLLESDRMDPVLTVWRYGLGKTAAWNTTSSDEWNEAYVGSEDYKNLWKRILDYVTNDSSQSGDKLEIRSIGEQAVLRYYADHFGEETVIQGLIQMEGNKLDSEAKSVKFLMTEPGVYEAVVENLTTGTYLISTERKDTGTILNSGFSVQYSDEYRLNLGSEAVDHFLEEKGRSITPEEDVWKAGKKLSTKKKDISIWLIMLAFLLFITEIALRRMGIESFGFGKRRNPSETKETNKAAGQGAERPVEEPVSSNAAADTDNKQERKKGKRQERKKQADVPQEGTLDVGELLKKKQDRNL